MSVIATTTSLPTHYLPPPQLSLSVRPLPAPLSLHECMSHAPNSLTQTAHKHLLRTHRANTARLHTHTNPHLLTTPSPPRTRTQNRTKLLCCCHHPPLYHCVPNPKPKTQDTATLSISLHALHGHSSPSP